MAYAQFHVGFIVLMELYAYIDTHTHSWAHFLSKKGVLFCGAEHDSLGFSFKIGTG